MIATNNALDLRNNFNSVSSINIDYNNYLNTKKNSLQLFGNDNLNYNYPFSYQHFDVQNYFIKNPGSSFLIKVKGDSMIGAGINNSDVLLVDKSQKANSGSIVVAEINGKLVVKRIKYIANVTYLMSENSKYKTIKIAKEDDFSIWGVVVSVIKTM